MSVVDETSGLIRNLSEQLEATKLALRQSERERVKLVEELGVVRMQLTQAQNELDRRKVDDQAEEDQIDEWLKGRRDAARLFYQHARQFAEKLTELGSTPMVDPEDAARVLELSRFALEDAPWEH